MTWFSRHPLSLTTVAVALAATGAVFGFARPEKQNLPVFNDVPLPYSKVLFSASDARRVFAAEGITLTPRSASEHITTLGNPRDVLEVNIFGDPAILNAGGTYANFPRSCTASSRTAARWHGNVRVVVNCTVDGDGASWMQRAQRALNRLALP